MQTAKKKEKLQPFAIKDPIRKTTKGNRQHRIYLKYIQVLFSEICHYGLTIVQ